MQTKIDQLINYLKTERFDKRSLREFMQDLDLSAKDIENWSDLEHSENDSYGRKTIHLGDHFELMVMSWVPGDFSMIHNHGDASWGMVQVFGEQTHRVYSADGMEIILVKEEMLTSGQIIPVSHELIHQMGNASDKPILSLHFYFNETPSEFITDNTFLYDVVNGEIQTVRGGAFYGLPEEEIIESKCGLVADEELVIQEEELYQSRMAIIS